MLGIDVLSHYGLLIDTAYQTLARKSSAVKKAVKLPLANATPRQTRHMASDAELTTKIKYIKRSNNIVADCLSKVEVNIIFFEITGIDLVQIANAKKTLTRVLDQQPVH